MSDFKFSSGTREIVIFVGLLGLFPVVAAIEPGTIELAQSNARSILKFEALVGINNEESLSRWLDGNASLNAVVQVLYYALHLSAVIAVLLWAYHRRPDDFAVIRNIFVGTQLVVVSGYLLFPTSPPHLLTEGATALNSSSDWIHNIQYAHAAFPSGHVGFATFVAIAVAISRPSLLVRIAGYTYPIFVAWMVVATGNHYWTDVIVGAAVPVIVALIVVPLVMRTRFATRPTLAESVVPS